MRNMALRVKITAWFLAIYLMSAVAILPAFSGPPYYHEEGNVNYPGSYYESVYIERSIGVDDYITVVDLALVARAYGTFDGLHPWGVEWGMFNPDADIHVNGMIDMNDLAFVNFFFGLNYHYAPFPDGKPPTQVKVNAPKGAIQVGQEFAVDVEIKHVEGLNMYEFALKWESHLLKAMSVVKGAFFPGIGHWMSILDNDAGYLYFGALAEGQTTQGGEGVLATITFECLDKGKATLDLSSRLFDISLISMDHKDVGGVVVQRS